MHELIETYKHSKQFILTGSSARKLRRAGTNLLAGRALMTHLHPFMAAELNENFNLNHALKHGLIPLILDAKDPQKTLATYIKLYLHEEVQTEGLVRNIGTFSRFLEMISLSHGSLLNLNNLARECQTSRKIIENNLSILEDLLLGYQLSVFTKGAKRATISHPKFYLFDAGVYYHLRPKGPLDQTSEIDDVALEGLVLQHLRAWCDYSNNDAKCYFWRTRGGAEIDFIVYGQHYFFAIEVKNTTRVHTTDLRAFNTFSKDYPEAKLLLLYRGTDRLLLNNVWCYPVEEFLLNLKPGSFPE